MTGTEMSLFAAGGPVMWPLSALAIVGALYFLERTLFLHRGQIRRDPFLAGIKNTLRKGRVVEALTLCEETPGPVSAVVRACLLHPAGSSEESLRAVMEEAARREIPVLERRVGTVAMVARTAPQLGLLGTVMGFYLTFRDLAAAGSYARFEVLTYGLGTALITTAAGIAFGVVFSVAHHFLLGRVRSLVHDMEAAAIELLRFRQQEEGVFLVREAVPTTEADPTEAGR